MTREEAIRDIEKCVIPYVGGISLRMAVEALKAQRRGEWKEKPRYEGDDQPDLECPFCGYSIGWWDLGYYCARCGARLTGSTVDDDPKTGGVDMRKRGLRTKMGFIDDAADAKPDFEYLKVGNTIYTQDDDKQGWTGRERE